MRNNLGKVPYLANFLPWSGSFVKGNWLINSNQAFPSGAVVKNPPANAGDMGSSPGPGRSHMPQNN